MSKIHELKTHPEYFQQVKAGNKTFECRFNDRNFQVGDSLNLLEYNPSIKEYTGEKLTGLIISYILSDWEGLKDGYVVSAQ